MKLKSNNRNVVTGLLMLIGLFVAALSGSGGARNSIGETNKRSDSEMRAHSRNTVGDAHEANGVQRITNPEAVADGLGPINPHVIASGGGMSSGGGFDLDGTIGEIGAGETLSGGSFTLDGGYQNVAPNLSPSSSATLGNYANTNVPLSANTTITPDAAPTNTTHLNVSTSTSFKGWLEGDPTTGVVRVTDAHPAGSYSVTVTAFDSGGLPITKTFILTVTTPATCNPVSFAPPANSGVGSRPDSIVVGDFNGDGKQDLATANGSVDNVSVLLGNGTGGFSAATNFAVGTLPTSVAVGDFDNDGNQDLVTSNQNSASVSILLGDGTGSFAIAASWAAGANPQSVAVGDFNGDFKDDLVVANGSNSVSVLMNDGEGNFEEPVSFAVGGPPLSVAVGEFNGDGKPDLATANGTSQNLSVLLGNGAGGFAAATNFNIAGNPQSVAVADLNGDGKQDLATAHIFSDKVSVLLGNGAGSFSAAAEFGVGSTPKSVALGDFNGDGKQDLVAANQNSVGVSILLGDGAGSFSTPLNFGSAITPVSVAVGDFNGDGMQDLATANLFADNLSVLLRQCASPTPTPTPTATPTPTPTPVPEINVRMASVNIADGDTSPSPADGTDFGNSEVNGGTVTHVFNIENLGIGPLNITSLTLSGPNASDFTIGELTPAGPIAQSNFAAFSVTFDPSVAGLRTATVNIGNDDSDENPYDFAIQGTGATCVQVSVPVGLTAQRNTVLTVPVNTFDTTGKGIISFDFALAYDASVLTPAATPYDTTNTLSSSFTITVNNNSSGTLVVSGFGTAPLSGLGTLLNLKFDVIGSAPACSNLNLLSFHFNEGTPCSFSGDGQACVANGTISGNVSYYIIAGPVKLVPGATLSAAGSPNVNATTDTNGAYALSSFGNGAYTVTPSKVGEVNGITAFDAALVAQEAVGLGALDFRQRAAADVSDNGAITSFDAALIAQTAIGLSNPSIAGTWEFVPSSRQYPNTFADQPNQNYEAILMGEVSGNWTPTAGAIPNFQPQTPSSPPVSVTIPNSAAPRGATVTIPLVVDDLSAHGIIAYQFDVTFDPNVLQPQASAANPAGTLSSEMTIAANSSVPGHIRIAAFGTAPLSGVGQLMKLNFTVVGVPGATTTLASEGFLFNEGDPGAITTNGQFSVASPTATEGAVVGGITDGNGAPIAGAVLSLSGTQNRKFISDANGNYRFENVQTNGFYTVKPSLANYSFNPAERSFSQLGNTTEAAFTGSRVSGGLNAIDTPDYFVRQHYLDFLGREPDESGFNFWSDQMQECGADVNCLERCRVNVSAAYFLSIEFQETGGLVDRLYRTSYGRPPLYSEFMPDSAAIGRGMIVGRAGWQQQLATNKQEFLDGWVQQPSFISVYGTLTSDAYVEQLIANTGVNYPASERDALVAGLTNGTLTRATVLRRIVENQNFVRAKFNEAFVMMQYFGYLRRDPDEVGYQFWLRKLNEFNGNFEQAEMVKAFLISGEYRQRFR